MLYSFNELESDQTAFSKMVFVELFPFSTQQGIVTSREKRDSQ
jgi:hypothetical protein